MNSDNAGTMYVRVVVKNVEDNTREAVSNTVYALFPAVRFTGCGQKTNGTAFNYRGETSAINPNIGETFVLQNDVCAGLLGRLVEALRKMVPVVSCRMICTTKAGIRVKIEVTL